MSLALVANATESTFVADHFCMLRASAIPAERLETEVGKSADFIVINQNLLEIPGNEIRKAKVFRTVLQRRTVYKK